VRELNLTRVFVWDRDLAAQLGAMLWTIKLPRWFLALAVVGGWQPACHWRWCVRNLPEGPPAVPGWHPRAARAAVLEGA